MYGVINYSDMLLVWCACVCIECLHFVLHIIISVQLLRKVLPFIFDFSHTQSSLKTTLRIKLITNFYICDGFTHKQFLR